MCNQGRNFPIKYVIAFGIYSGFTFNFSKCLYLTPERKLDVPHWEYLL